MTEHNCDICNMTGERAIYDPPTEKSICMDCWCLLLDRIFCLITEGKQQELQEFMEGGEEDV